MKSLSKEDEESQTESALSLLSSSRHRTDPPPPHLLPIVGSGNQFRVQISLRFWTDGLDFTAAVGRSPPPPGGFHWSPHPRENVPAEAAVPSHNAIGFLHMEASEREHLRIFIRNQIRFEGIPSLPSDSSHQGRGHSQSCSPDLENANSGKPDCQNSRPDPYPTY